jgi:ABC-type transporter Mla maintaining outer membrane lipid asymmetry ATPase subunit MlaF
MTVSAPPPPTTETVLDVRSLSVRYGNVIALDDVSFSVARGSVMGLIGPNGAGKTTLIDALTNYTRASGGEVEFEGRSSAGERPHRLARRGLVRTFQSVELFDDLTVEENLAVASQPPSLLAALGRVFTGGGETRTADVSWALSVTELEDVADRYPAELSHGRRRRDPRTRPASAHAARSRGLRAAHRPRHGLGAQRLRPGDRAGFRQPDRRGDRGGDPRRPPSRRGVSGKHRELT